ncbi:hypothetical protein MMC14_003673 [Varicellaria rhodocarpa]|nr:hypothetical protein [Varicellaria rhodocarpa]
MPRLNTVVQSKANSVPIYRRLSVNTLSDLNAIDHGNTHGYRHRSRNVTSSPLPPPPSSLISLVPIRGIGSNDSPISSSTATGAYYLEPSIVSRESRRQPRPLCVADNSPWTRSPDESIYDNEPKLNPFNPDVVEDDDAATEVGTNSPVRSVYSNAETLTSIDGDERTKDFKPLKRLENASTNLHGLHSSCPDPFYPPLKKTHIYPKPVPPQNISRCYRFSSLPNRKISRQFDIDIETDQSCPPPVSYSAPFQTRSTVLDNDRDTTTPMPLSFMDLDSDDEQGTDNAQRPLEGQVLGGVFPTLLLLFGA